MFDGARLFDARRRERSGVNPNEPAIDAAPRTAPPATPATPVAAAAGTADPNKAEATSPVESAPNSTAVPAAAPAPAPDAISALAARPRHRAHRIDERPSQSCR